MLQSNIKIVLVGTLYGGNIGSTCRAMANMGITELRLVAPHEDVDWTEAEKMACHAEHILAERKRFDTLAHAVSDCIAVVGTTAREGLYRQHAKTPNEWAKEIALISAQGSVAIVFGREDKGLLNEEIAQCTHLVKIPTANEYSSLNLSQAVMILCYELFLAQGKFDTIKEKSERATAELRERMFDMWRDYLLSIGFMEEPKADHMMAAIRRILSRGAITENDVTIMMGVIRQSRWAIGTRKQ